MKVSNYSISKQNSKKLEHKDVKGDLSNGQVLPLKTHAEKLHQEIQKLKIGGYIF
jgi:hypothetical protein